MIKIFSLDAFPGAGKSYAALLSAHASALHGACYLFVLPTVALIKEAADQLRRFSPQLEPEIIHHETAPIVGAALLSALKGRPEHGRILFITWSAFESLSFFPGRELWSVVVDEIPQLAKADELIVPDSHTYLTEHIELHPLGPVWSRVIVSQKGPLQRLANTSDASLKATLAPVARTLLSPYWISYTRSEAFHSLVAGKGRKLTLHHVLRPRIFEGFKRVTILSANFKNSLLYLHWNQEGGLFEEDEDLRAGLRFTHHAHGDLVTICYGLEELWSKAVRDRQNKLVWERLLQTVKDRIGGSPFGWVANKDVGADLFPSMAAERLPQVSHGLNAWQHLDNIVFLSARLPTPDHFSFLEWLGISEDQVRRAINLEAVYQTVLRCSIRDPDNLNPKTVVVPDRLAADFLHNLLPGSKIEKLAIDLDGVVIMKPRGRPRVHQNGTGKVQHLRAKRRAEINRLTALMSADPDAISNEDLSRHYQMVRQESCNENPIKEGFFTSVTKDAMGSIFDHVSATHPVAIVTDVSVEMFIEVLRHAHKRTLTRKEDNHHFSPAVFDPELSPVRDRGLDNVVYANGVWLDFDHGNLTHKDMANLFSDLRLVAFNTFSSTKAQPRFRVYIQTSRVVTKDEYDFLTGQILQVIKNAGYRLPKKDVLKPHLKAHGIDMSKLHAASLFYLPCQPQDPKGRIWKDYAKDKSGARRQPLDVDKWLENAIAVETVDDIPEATDAASEDRPVDQARVDRAMDRWRTIGVQEGNGDHELFILHLELRAANVPRRERAALLLEAARMANSPADRVRQAHSLIKAG